MDRRQARQATRLAGGSENDRAELPAGRTEAAGITALGLTKDAPRQSETTSGWSVGPAAVLSPWVWCPRAPRLHRTQGRQACCSKNAQEKFCAPDARKGCSLNGLDYSFGEGM